MESSFNYKVPPNIQYNFNDNQNVCFSCRYQMLASWPHLHAINFILPGAINWTDLVLCDNWIFIALEASKLCFSCERSYVIATALSTLHTRLEKQDFVRKNKQTWKYFLE